MSERAPTRDDGSEASTPAFARDAVGGRGRARTRASGVCVRTSARVIDTASAFVVA